MSHLKIGIYVGNYSVEKVRKHFYIFDNEITFTLEPKLAETCLLVCSFLVCSVFVVEIFKRKVARPHRQ